MVGVIVPAHGFVPYLAETLDCILAQEPAPAAVVVVDDASPEPIALHPDHADRCQLVRRSSCGGPQAARSTGAEVLGDSVELIALCDSDDSWRPGKLAVQIAALAAEPAAVACFGRARIVGTDGRPTGERWAEMRPGLHLGTEFTNGLYESNPIPTSSVVVRRDALEAAGGFRSPVQIVEDWDIWLRLAARGGGFVCVDQTLIDYRRHPGGLTANVPELARQQIALHELHGDLVSDELRERMLAADAAALAAAQRRGLRGLLPRRDPYRR